MTIKTKYYGIYIQVENGDFWLIDDNGNNDFFGKVFPTNVEIENFRNEVTKWKRYTIKILSFT